MINNLYPVAGIASFFSQAHLWLDFSEFHWVVPICVQGLGCLIVDSLLFKDKNYVIQQSDSRSFHAKLTWQCSIKENCFCFFGTFVTSGHTIAGRVWYLWTESRSGQLVSHCQVQVSKTESSEQSLGQISDGDWSTKILEFGQARNFWQENGACGFLQNPTPHKCWFQWVWRLVVVYPGVHHHAKCSFDVHFCCRHQTSLLYPLDRQSETQALAQIDQCMEWHFFAQVLRILFEQTPDQAPICVLNPVKIPAQITV